MNQSRIRTTVLLVTLVMSISIAGCGGNEPVVVVPDASAASLDEMEAYNRSAAEGSAERKEAKPTVKKAAKPK